MIQLDAFDKITFLIIICFSFLIFTFSISMNRKASFSKSLGIAFFLPFILCTYSFLSVKAFSFTYIYWVSEICLSIIFLILILIKVEKEKHKLIGFTIVGVSLGLCVLLAKLDILPFYSLSNKTQTLTLVYLVSINLLILKLKKFPEQSFLRANLFLLISIMLNYFNEQKYVLVVALVFRLIAYLTFYIYFHRRTYERHMSMVKEVHKLKKGLDRTLDKEVKKQLLHYEIAKEKLLMKSKTDSLTKAYNKETILNIIDDLIKFKEDEQFAILMFDIDNFKEINDTYGHITGDVCIKNLVNAARECIRETDSLGRYGGDEFIIVLPSLDLQEAKFVADRFRKNVIMMQDPKFTISIGLSVYPQDGKTVNDLISSADKGLYSSKHKGKNTVSHSKLL